MHTVDPDLWPLLEALCENRISDQELLRLETLVLQSPAARQLYVQYLDLHGSLYWHAAFGIQAGDLPDGMSLPISETEINATDLHTGDLHTLGGQKSSLSWEAFAAEFSADLEAPAANLAETFTQQLSSNSKVIRATSEPAKLSGHTRTARASHHKWARKLVKSAWARPVASAAAIIILVTGLSFLTPGGNARQATPVADTPAANTPDDTQVSNSQPANAVVVDVSPTGPRKNLSPVELPLASRTEGEGLAGAKPEVWETAGNTLPSPWPGSAAPARVLTPEELARQKALADSVSAFVRSTNPPQMTLTYPGGSAAAWQVVSRIDAELANIWQKQNVTASPVCDDALWHRRVYLDLTGHIPTVQETETFLADQAPARRERLIDRLLEDPGFSRQMATVWTNLLLGRQTQEEIDRDRFYEYLRVSFAGERAWNRIVGELVSATGRSHENGATNFLLAHLHDDAISATRQISLLFLGEPLTPSGTSGPASTVTPQDLRFWELNSFLRQAHAQPVLVMEPGQSKTVRSALALSDLPIGGPTTFTLPDGKKVDVFPKLGQHAINPSEQIFRRQELASLLESDVDQQVARAFVHRTWNQFLGSGFSAQGDDLSSPTSQCHAALLELVTREFVQSNYDVRELVRWITNCKAYQLASQLSGSNGSAAETGTASAQADCHNFHYFLSRPLLPEQVFDSVLILEHPVSNTPLFWEQAYQDRKEWLATIQPLSNSTSTNSSADDLGLVSIQQALLRLQPNLSESGLGIGSTSSNTWLKQILTREKKDVDRINAITLSLLSRRATPSELRSVRQAIQARPAGQPSSREERDAATQVVWQDFVWALFNSSEFSLQH